jgi:hypothetical protein
MTENDRLGGKDKIIAFLPFQRTFKVHSVCRVTVISSSLSATIMHECG